MIASPGNGNEIAGQFQIDRSLVAHRRVQDAVNQRFDRSRYSAARTVDGFAYRLRDEVDLTALQADLLGAVQLTMAPAHVSLWLRARPR